MALGHWVATAQRLRGVQMGAGCSVSPLATLSEPSLLTLGDRVRIGRHVELSPQGGGIWVGSDCSLNNSVVIYGAGSVLIGDSCRIGHGSMLISSNHTFEDLTRPIRLQPLTAVGVQLEEDVWLGAKCIVLDGVTVGRGAVVGAGSVVTRDIPPFSVSAGNPARLIRSREVKRPKSQELN